MKVAVIYTDQSGETVPAAEALKNLREFTEHYRELPIRPLSFQPVVLRHGRNPGQESINVTWVYSPLLTEREVVENAPSELIDFDGLELPRGALWIPSAPLWVKIGMEYAREIYKPLLASPFGEAATQWLLRWSREDPTSFNEIAMLRPISKRTRKRFAFAYLLGKWDLMQALGQHVSEEFRRDDLVKTLGITLSTRADNDKIDRWIYRELAKKSGRPRG